MRNNRKETNEQQLVQTLWLVLRAGFDSGRNSIAAGRGILCAGVCRYRSAFAFGERHTLRNIPIFRVLFSAAELDRVEHEWRERKLVALRTKHEFEFESGKTLGNGRDVRL